MDIELARGAMRAAARWPATRPLLRIGGSSQKSAETRAQAQYHALVADLATMAMAALRSFSCGGATAQDAQSVLYRWPANGHVRFFCAGGLFCAVAQRFIKRSKSCNITHWLALLPQNVQRPTLAGASGQSMGHVWGTCLQLAMRRPRPAYVGLLQRCAAVLFLCRSARFSWRVCNQQAAYMRVLLY